jgi:hypothetical protein
MSSVFVMVIDWMEMGAPPPMSTVPRRMRRERRRAQATLVSAFIMGIDKSSEEWASHSVENASLGRRGVLERLGMLVHDAAVAKT